MTRVLQIYGAETKAHVDSLPPIEYGLFLKCKERLLVFGESHNWCNEAYFEICRIGVAC